MKVLVTGSRHHTNRGLIQSVLTGLSPDFIIEGGATGADSWAKEWARINKVAVASYPAKWKRYGKAAGSIRNQQMIDEHPDVDMVVAFPLPKSKGTWDMVDRAKKLGIDVLVVKDD